MVETVGLLVDDGEQFLSSISLDLGRRKQRSDRQLDGGERRAEFVRDAVQQGGAQLLAFTRRLRSGEGFGRSCALNGNRDQAADRLQRLARKHCPFQSQAPNRPYSDT